MTHTCGSKKPAPMALGWKQNCLPTGLLLLGGAQNLALNVALRHGALPRHKQVQSATHDFKDGLEMHF